jgi:SulP family sulfate permease
MVTIPAAMAYSQMAGLQPINGLYASLLAMVIYALLGTSRHLIIGSEATMAILVASSLAAVAADGDPARFLALATLEAIIIGAIQLTSGVARIGFIADFIPKSVITGFLNGMALIIILSQVGKISGINLTQEEFFPQIWELYNKIHLFHKPTLILGAACLMGLFLFSFVPVVPEAVLVVVLATVAVIAGDLGAQGVKLVGSIPAGLPHLVIPNVGFQDILALIPYAAGVALVSYFDVITTGRAFALKGGYRIDPNQDMIALGVANIGAGLFQGFALGCSQSRTVVNNMYGGKSQFAGLLAAGLLALFLLQFTYILKDVPLAALATIIIAAAFSLLDLKEVVKIMRTRPASGLVCLVTTCAVLIAGLMTGILVSVALAMILVLHRLARPHEIITRPPSMPNFMIYRFAGPLFFFNAAYFAHRVQEVIEEATAKAPVTFFLINAEAIVDMDINAAEMLAELHQFFRKRNIVLGICQAKGHFRKVLLSTHLTDREGLVLYPTIGEVFQELTKKQLEEEAVKTAAVAIEAATEGKKTPAELVAAEIAAVQEEVAQEEANMVAATAVVKEPVTEDRKTTAEIAASEVAAADKDAAELVATEIAAAQDEGADEVAPGDEEGADIVAMTAAVNKPVIEVRKTTAEMAAAEVAAAEKVADEIAAGEDEIGDKVDKSNNLTQKS